MCNKKTIEKDAITKWINSFTFPTPPPVEDAENIKIVDDIQTRFNQALAEAIKLNKLPF